MNNTTANDFSFLDNVPESDFAIVVPDVHGRYFWADQIKAMRNQWPTGTSEIIFLGDYADSHSDVKNPLPCNQLAPLLDIVTWKEDRPEKTTLLIGNHDFGYLFGYENCSRMASERGGYFHRFCEIFQAYKDLFRMTATRRICGKLVLFSHAGITKQWVQNVYQNLGFKTYEDCAIAILKGFLNKVYLNAIKGNENAAKVLSYVMSTVAPIRGGDDGESGSPIWCDESEWQQAGGSPYEGVTQIVGHNRLTGSDTKIARDVYCYDFYEPKIKVIPNR